MDGKRRNIASHLGISILSVFFVFVSQIASAQNWGRAENIVVYFDTEYDGACLYSLANMYKHLSDDEYVPLMEYCRWNGVENPSAPDIPAGKINCNSVPCVRSLGGRV